MADSNEQLLMIAMDTKSLYDESKSAGFIILYIHTTAIQTVYGIVDVVVCWFGLIEIMRFWKRTYYAILETK